MKSAKLFAAVFAALLTGQMLSGAENAGSAESAEVKAPVKKVALFKNGLGAVVREINFPAAGSYFLTDSLSPVHGTLWFTAPGNMLVQSVPKTFMAENPGSKGNPAVDYQGKEVQIEYSTGNGIAVAAGTVLPQPVQNEQPRPEPRPYYYASQPSVPSWINLKTIDGRVISLRCDRIVSILSTGKAEKIPVRRNVLQFKLPEKPAAPVQMSYLAKGISWAPAYRIDLKGEKKMTLTMSAVITNGLEDLKDAEVSLISGFPNIHFANVRSPLSGISLQQFFNELNTAGRNGNANPVMMQKVMYNGAAVGGSDASDLAIQGSTSGEDIQYRNIGKITMGKGGSLYMTLETAETDCERLVEWTIPNNIDANGYRKNDSRFRTENADLWDCVRFKNPLKSAMTSAPIETVQDGRVLGQSTGSWFNPGQTALVRTTKALTVTGKFSEYDETPNHSSKVRSDIVYLYGSAYREHILNGVIELENFREKPVKVLVKREISGELISGEFTKREYLSRGVLGVNKLCELTWECTLQPKEKKVYKYQHKVLIRH